MAVTQPILSIVICTRNRATYLAHCLQSFKAQEPSGQAFEVLIIDNKSTDQTFEISRQFTTANVSWVYYQCSVVGLSFARNAGYNKANGVWVAFIDDDAVVPLNFVSRIFWMIQHHDFDCFGGVYTPWYPEGKPSWLPSTFGAKEKLRTDVGPLQSGFLSGGMMVCKKVVLEDLGGFSTQIGMRDKLGYGEDDELQIRMREAGYRIGFDPELTMQHAVLPHKFKLSWHLKAALAKGRDREVYQKEQGWGEAFFALCWSVLGGILKRFPISLFKGITQREYYWQNAAYEIISPIAYHWGRLKGISNLKRP